MNNNIKYEICLQSIMMLIVSLFPKMGDNNEKDKIDSIITILERFNLVKRIEDET